jgi:hypothetical protein
MFTAPAVNDQVVIYTSKAGIFAHDRITGDELWFYAHPIGSGGKMHRSAALTDSLVYTAGDVFFAQTPRGYDPISGDLVYLSTRNLRESTAGAVIGPGPGGVGTRVILMNGGFDNEGSAPTHGRIYSFIPPDTSPEWTHYLVTDPITTSAPYQRYVNSIQSTPAWSGGFIYFGTDDGVLYCLNVENGYRRWSYDLGVPIRSSPAIAGNMLFVNGSDGTLFAFVKKYIDTASSDAGDSPSGLRTRLIGNWPNPFNPSTHIRFDIGPDGINPVPVSLTIYDLAGRHVRALVNGPLEPGAHTATWDGRNDSGRRVASSVYFYKLEVGEKNFTRKLTLTK